MKMKPEEITAIIKKQIEDYNVEMNVDDVGTVLEVGDGIAHIYGLDKAMSGELLELPHGVLRHGPEPGRRQRRRRTARR